MVNSHNTAQEWIPGRFMSACEKKKNIPRKQSSGLVSLKHRTVLGKRFHDPPKCSKEEWIYFRFPIIACCCYPIKCLRYHLYTSTGKHDFAMCCLSLWLHTTWTSEDFTHVTFLNPQWQLSRALNKAGYYMRLESASSDRFSQVPLPLARGVKAALKFTFTLINFNLFQGTNRSKC